jgi:hypothetical protein
MRFRKTFFIILAGLLCGCSHDDFTKGRGDVGQFIVQQAVTRSGLSIPTNGLPAIRGSWRYSEDDQGVIIQMSREQYPAVETLLRQAFGEPNFGPDDTKDGGKLGGYRLTPKGGAIQFGYNAGCTQVIILRPLTKQEFSEAFQKAVPDKKFLENLNK